jgi:hypothetical protein
MNDGRRYVWRPSRWKVDGASSNSTSGLRTRRSDATLRTAKRIARIIGHGLRLSIAGIILGVAAAMALTRVMASLLVGVSATDPLTFATMAIVFAIVATFAAWIPARRAAALNPNVALRDE